MSNEPVDMNSCFGTGVPAVLHILVNKHSNMMQEEIDWRKGHTEELNNMKTCKHDCCHVQTLNQYFNQTAEVINIALLLFRENKGYTYSKLKFTNQSTTYKHTDITGEHILNHFNLSSTALSQCYYL